MIKNPHDEEENLVVLSPKEYYNILIIISKLYKRETMQFIERKQEANMKKRLITFMMMAVLTMSLAACGSESDTTNTNAESNNASVGSEAINTDDTNTDSSNVEATTDSETPNVEEEKAPATITMVKEEEAVIDFDGVKLPMTISWEEFKQFMADNNWTFEDEEDEFPNENKLSGGGLVNTNCGKVKFRFDKNEDGTQSVLMSVLAYSVYSPATISISGINAETSVEELAKILKPVENNEAGLYLDDYLTVYVSDATFSIVRTFFHMR